MGAENKVVWSEGMFLRPQHFQQQDRYIERVLRQRVAAVRAFGWGVTEFALQREALSTGRIAIASAAGVLDDGTSFSIPGDTDAPPPLDVPDTARNARVYLMLPLRRSGMPDIVLRDRDDTAARYTAGEVAAPDAIVGSDAEAQLQVGKPRIRLAIDGPQLDLGGFSALPVARVLEVRGGDRQVVLDDQYMPPAMTVAAIPPLAAFAVELQGLLSHRSEALAARLSAPGMRGAGEMANLLMLQAVNRYWPVSAHHGAAPLLHPEDYYAFLLAVAGELCTFTVTRRRPPDFPPYKHDDLNATFSPVIASLRQSLSAVLESGAVQIPLQERKYGVHVGVIQDRTLLRSASFVLAVRAELTAEVIRRSFPAAIKIGPVEQIARLVQVAVPGIGLSPLPVAPPQLPYVANTTYFELDRTSEYFRALANAGGIALHIGGEWPKLEMELWAIRAG